MIASRLARCALSTSSLSSRQFSTITEEEANQRVRYAPNIEREPIQNDSWPMLKRELIADVLQNSIKFAAYKLSGSQAMKAELMRAGIDAFNHVIMYFANNWAQQPRDEYYAYGYGRYKNLAVLLPGIGFAFSGMYNTFAPIMSLFQDSAVEEHVHITSTALASIFACSFGEVFLFYKNMGDISEDQDYNVLSRMYYRMKLSADILAKKREVDPIMDAIVAENILSMVGVFVPLVTSGTIFMLGWEWVDNVGELINGILQIYLGYKITNENVCIIMGRSMSKEELNNLLHVINDRENVADITHLKSVYLNSDQLSIQGTVKFDPQIIGEKVAGFLTEEAKKRGFDDERLQKVQELLVQATDETLTEMTECIRTAETSINMNYPFISQIDLEQGPTNIDKHYAQFIPDDEFESTETEEEV